MDLRLGTSLVVTGIVIGTSLLLAYAQPEPPPSSACTSFADLAQPCGCAFTEETFDPKCGSDGVTYLGECYLECRKYINGVDIKMEYSGACVKEFQCECPSEYVPVCGSNGVTYSNECTLGCATAKDSRIRLKHTGKCCSGDQRYTETYNDETRRYSNLRSSRRKKKKQQLLRQRTQQPEFHRPSSEFFKQPFDVEPHRKTHKPRSSLQDTIGVIVELESSEPIIPKIFMRKCVCAEVHRPVCGNDVKTYANFCVFFCMSKSDATLKFTHWGACKKPKPTTTTTTAPPRSKATNRHIITKDGETEMQCVCKVLLPEPLRCGNNRRPPPQSPKCCYNHRT